VATEILGYDEILGDYLVGQGSPGGMRSRMSANPRAVALARAAGGNVVTQREPTRSKEIPLGFDSVSTIAAAATSDVTSRPQVTFRPDRLVIPSTIAASFLVTDLKIGNKSQFASSTSLPAEVFTQGAFGVRLKMDTAQISQDVTLRVTNLSGGALRFFAALIGPSVE
jgi:hypothetical protein